VENTLNKLNEKLGEESPLTKNQRKVLEYQGITIDQKGKVCHV